MFVFEKFAVLCFFWNTRFAIRPFALLPTKFWNFSVIASVAVQISWLVSIWGQHWYLMGKFPLSSCYFFSSLPPSKSQFSVFKNTLKISVLYHEKRCLSVLRKEIHPTLLLHKLFLLNFLTDVTKKSESISHSSRFFLRLERSVFLKNFEKHFFAILISYDKIFSENI